MQLPSFLLGMVWGPDREPKDGERGKRPLLPVVVHAAPELAPGHDLGADISGRRAPAPLLGAGSPRATSGAHIRTPSTRALLVPFWCPFGAR